VTTGKKRTRRSRKKLASFLSPLPTPRPSMTPAQLRQHNEWVADYVSRTTAQTAAFRMRQKRVAAVPEVAADVDAPIQVGETRRRRK
jgi:hypothetical protein